jgi:hypothetical protein
MWLPGLYDRRVLRRISVVLLLGASLIPMPAAAIDADTPVDRPVTATAAAAPASPLATDIVTVNNTGPLTEANALAALNAARSVGGTAAIGRSASVGMTSVTRGGAAVQVAPPGFAYPMGTTVLPLEFVSRAMGRSISGLLRADTVVMGSLTASLRGAAAGDTISLTASWGGQMPYIVAAVVDDAVLGGTELLMSPAGADRMGISQLSQVVIWGFSSRWAIDTALSMNGLVNTRVRIRRSWDPFDPDFTIGMARTKASLGEFAYRVNPSGSVTLDSAWTSTFITYGSIRGLSLASGCHSVTRVALQAAMDEVVASGLAGTINYYDANRAGGCFGPRFNRLTPDSSVGFLSRHTWGQAVDTNTIGSCQGCAPPDMDCRTVQIFRKHGFAWGGNFLTPDGMHFEWVGERRDQYPYPSRFCPNAVGDATAPTVPAETQRATLFEDAGLLAE